MVHVFIGATLTATSVGITARVLKDLNVTGRPEAQTIIGAAILDDVLGLIVLAVVAGSVMEGDGVSAATNRCHRCKGNRIFGVAVLLGHFLSGPTGELHRREQWTWIAAHHGIALCFMGAYVAETVGLAAIIVAFAAGGAGSRSEITAIPQSLARADQSACWNTEAVFDKLRRARDRVKSQTCFIATGLRRRRSRVRNPRIFGVSEQRPQESRSGRERVVTASYAPVAEYAHHRGDLVGGQRRAEFLRGGLHGKGLKNRIEVVAL